MIVRDEAARLARCLASVRDHVDRMIVLDTGSTDGTPAIAAAYGAEVHRFAWCDDFAKARNVALDHSGADWNLVLDADEQLAEGGSALGPDALPAGSGGFIGQVRIVSDTDAGGAPARGQAWAPRVLPRGVRYAGRIHEQPVSDLPHRRLPVRLAHSGYLTADLVRKGDRNERLLIAELEASPDDGYLWFQLGREYVVRDKPQQAAVCLTEAARLSPADAAWGHALTVRTVTALKDADRMDEALAFAEHVFEAWRDSPDFLYALGDLYLAQAARDPQRALSDHLPLAEWAWKRCLEVGDRDDLDGSVHGRGGYMAAHNLAVMYETLGRADLAEQHRTLSARLRPDMASPSAPAPAG
jgi:tetratricopeptide (TPR) repeat protein